MLRAHALKMTAALGAIGALFSGVVAVQAAGTFRSIPPANPGSAELFGVSATSATVAWAMGVKFLDQNTVIATLAERWNGKVWQIVPSASPTGNVDVLYGVANISANNAWAVGYSDTSSGYRALIEQWNGVSWNAVPAATDPTSFGEFLYAVTAVSASDIWAVGTHFDSTVGGDVALIEHYDGSRWSFVSNPSFYDGGQHVIPDLDTVSAISSTDVWAATSSGVQQGVFEHWDGKTWSVVLGPLKTSVNNVNIQSVAGSSSTDVWAVGHTRGFGRRAPTIPVLEHWDGNNWSDVTTPTGNATELFTVAALAGNDAWAVGYNFNSPAGTLVQHWDGTSWNVIPVAATTGSQILQISSVAPHTLFGVGNFGAILSTDA